MSDAEFTAGPWKASGNGVHVGIRCVAIAYDPKGREYAPSPVALANARLIAASPALYEALMRCVMEMNSASELIDEPYVENYFGAISLANEALGLANPKIAELNARVASARAEIEKAK